VKRRGGVRRIVARVGLLGVLAMAGEVVAAPPQAGAKSGVAAGKPRWQTLPAVPAMPTASDHGAVEVGGAKIYYAVYGKGAPVVLLHGGLGHAGQFGFQVPALVDKFQVIAIDSRGQGRSTKGKVAITYDVMASDVVAVLDKLAVKRASFVGWSDGGEIALKLGIGFPDRVERMIVFGANYDANGSKSRSRPSATFNAYMVRSRAEYEKLSKESGGAVSYRALIEALTPLWRNASGITKDQLRAIKAPVLMADGDHDEVIELDQIKEMAELIPNGKLKVFANASHFAMWQDPESFNAAMLEFLGAER
jgi:pimeloyl-ACP methyl ester carboxylesterase